MRGKLSTNLFLINFLGKYNWFLASLKWFGTILTIPRNLVVEFFNLNGHWSDFIFLLQHPEIKMLGFRWKFSSRGWGLSGNQLDGCSARLSQSGWRLAQVRRMRLVLGGPPRRLESFLFFWRTSLPLTSTRWVRKTIELCIVHSLSSELSEKLSNIEIFWVRRESNPGPLGEKRKCNFCAIRAPFVATSLKQFCGQRNWMPEERKISRKVLGSNLLRAEGLVQ